MLHQKVILGLLISDLYHLSNYFRPLFILLRRSFLLIKKKAVNWFTSSVNNLKEEYNGRN